MSLIVCCHVERLISIEVMFHTSVFFIFIIILNNILRFKASSYFDHLYLRVFNMSTSRGSDVRKRRQKHQNRSAFKNNLHDTSHKTKFINSLEVTGVCDRCKEIIEWKIKYKKYKPLNTPRKCITCEQKTVKYAYHMMCTQCATVKQICAKCCKPVTGEETETVGGSQKADLKSMLKDLPERKRRTILRQLSKQDGQQNLTPEIMAQIEDMMSKMENVDLDEELFSSDGDNSLDLEDDE